MAGKHTGASEYGRTACDSFTGKSSGHLTPGAVATRGTGRIRSRARYSRNISRIQGTRRSRIYQAAARPLSMEHFKNGRGTRYPEKPPVHKNEEIRFDEGGSRK